MPVYISLLRGINVGGNKRIKMEALRTIYENLGMTQVKTLLQSGNVVFESDLTDRAEIAKRLEEGIEQGAGFHSTIILRTVDELRDAIRRSPFDAELDPGKVLVMFLAAVPSADTVEYSGPETIHIDGTEVYLYYPDGLGRSKLSHTFIESRLKVEGTARNWRTVTGLLDLAEAYPIN